MNHRGTETMKRRRHSITSGRPLGIISLTLVLLVMAGAGRQREPSPQAVREQVRAYRQKHDVAIVRTLAEFLSLPNVASDRENIEKNARWILREFERRGIRGELLRVGDSPPVVYGEQLVPGARRTVVFYVHYDGQPVDPSQWATDPWTPVLRDNPLEQGGRLIEWSALRSPVPGEWRLYARSASDDKSPLIALLTALDALRAAEIPLSVNIKFFLEGEEEAGSPHLADLIRRYADRLTADVWLLCDGPVHQTRRPQVYFGARGIADLELTVYGPIRPLHSGHYGNWAPNPAVLLSHLLVSMRTPEGRIQIPGFYDDVRPLTEREKQALADVPHSDAPLRNDIGVAWTEGSGKKLNELIMAPALNVRGIQAGHVGETAQNAIPTEARASIDFRLVPDQTPEGVRRRVEDHIRRQGFYIVSETPDLSLRRRYPRIVKLEWGPGYPPARTSMDAPVSQALLRLLADALGTPIIALPTLGGSVPMYLFLDVLRTPVIGVPIVNHDNNQHGANENLRLQNLWDGIEMFAVLLAGLGRAF